jgi:hypothetical protein
VETWEDLFLSHTVKELVYIDLTHTDRIPLSTWYFNADCAIILMQTTVEEYERICFVLTNMSLRKLLDDLINDKIEGMNHWDRMRIIVKVSTYFIHCMGE